MLAIIGLLILTGLLSAIGYNRLTALYNQAVLADQALVQASERLIAAKQKASGLQQGPEAQASAPISLAPLQRAQQQYAIQAEQARADYDAAKQSFPASVIARLGGFADLPSKS
jgi:hypothetical protein